MFAISMFVIVLATCDNHERRNSILVYSTIVVVFLNRRAAARYRALASIIPGRERFSWNLSF